MSLEQLKQAFQELLKKRDEVLTSSAYDTNQSDVEGGSKRITQKKLLKPASFQVKDVDTAAIIDSYRRDLQELSDGENTAKEDTNLISIQKNPVPVEATPKGSTVFEYTPVSDSESEAESIVDDGEGYTTGAGIPMDKEDTGQVRYIKLGPRITKDDFSKKTPRFMKVAKDYFNSKLDALKIRITGKGSQYAIELDEARNAIKEFHFPRYCGRCKQVISNSRKGCLCDTYEPGIGNVYIRSEPEMRLSLYNSLYTNPKTLTYAMERALTLMNTTSYQQVMEDCAIIGLDCEMWSVMTKSNTPGVSDTIHREFVRHYHSYSSKIGPNSFRSFPMVVEAGISMQLKDGTVQQVLNEKFRIPRTWTQPQLIHPAAHRIKDNAVALIDYFIKSSFDQEEEQQLRDELERFKNSFHDLARYAGGMSYKKYPHMVEAFDYMDEGPQGFESSLWMSLLTPSERKDFPSFVRTKPVKSGGLSAEVTVQGGRRCCFDAGDIVSAKLRSLPPGVIVVYSGENDFDCLSIYPEGDHIIVDISWLPVIRLIIKNIAEWDIHGMNMLVHPSDLFNLRKVELMKLSKLWVRVMKPTPEMERQMLEGAHSATIDAQMTRELFVVAMEFRQRNAAIFDLMAPVELDRTFYKILMRAAFDKETQGPVGVVKHGVEGKRLRQVLRTGVLHGQVCGHTPWKQQRR